MIQIDKQSQKHNDPRLDKHTPEKHKGQQSGSKQVQSVVSDGLYDVEHCETTVDSIKQDEN